MLLFLSFFLLIYGGLGSYFGFLGWGFSVDGGWGLWCWAFWVYWVGALEINTVE